MEFLVISGIAVVFFLITIIADRMMASSEEQTPAEPPAKPKRARTKKGQFKADDPSTPNVNEAWVDGKAPKPKKKRTTRKKKSVKKTK